jgi:hypothetical protein
VNLKKAFSRDRKRDRRNQGMVIDNKSIFILEEEKRKKAEEIKRRREEKEEQLNVMP